MMFTGIYNIIMQIKIILLNSIQYHYYLLFNIKSCLISMNKKNVVKIRAKEKIFSLINLKNILIFFIILNNLEEKLASKYSQIIIDVF